MGQIVSPSLVFLLSPNFRERRPKSSLGSAIKSAAHKNSVFWGRGREAARLMLLGYITEAFAFSDTIVPHPSFSFARKMFHSLSRGCWGWKAVTGLGGSEKKAEKWLAVKWNPLLVLKIEILSCCGGRVSNIFFKKWIEVIVAASI